MKRILRPRKAKANLKGRIGKPSSKENRYRVRNWSEYNKALKERGSLTIWFSEEAIQAWYYDGPHKRGAQITYSDLSIETALTLKVVYNLALRQTEGFLRSIVELLNLDIDVPDYSTISRRQGLLDIDLSVRPSDRSVHIVVDSTGVKVYGEGEWKVRQYGYSRRRTWRKLHLGVDEETGEILAETLTTNRVDDASCVELLLYQINRPISAFGADGSYDKKEVYSVLANPPGQDGAILPIIPPRRDAKIEQHGNSSKELKPRDENIREIRKLGREKWKEESGYHRRSIGESAISRYKRIIGPSLKAREIERQRTESRIGCAILNRMAYLGMPDSYKVEIA